MGKPRLTSGSGLLGLIISFGKIESAQSEKFQTVFSNVIEKAEDFRIYRSRSIPLYLSTGASSAQIL